MLKTKGMERVIRIFIKLWVVVTLTWTRCAYRFGPDDVFIQTDGTRIAATEGTDHGRYLAHRKIAVTVAYADGSRSRVKHYGGRRFNLFALFVGRNIFVLRGLGNGFFLRFCAIATFAGRRTVDVHLDRVCLFWKTSDNGGVTNE